MQRELKTFGMNRIVDVEKVLGYLKNPGVNSRLHIGVSDSSIEWNNGVFTVSFEDGTTSVQKSAAAPDVNCTVQALTRFATGYTSLAKEVEYNTVELLGNRELLFSLFPQKEMFMTESF